MDGQKRLTDPKLLQKQSQHKVLFIQSNFLYKKRKFDFEENEISKTFKIFYFFNYMKIQNRWWLCPGIYILSEWKLAF